MVQDMKNRRLAFTSVVRDARCMNELKDVHLVFCHVFLPLPCHGGAGHHQRSYFQFFPLLFFWPVPRGEENHLPPF